MTDTTPLSSRTRQSCTHKSADGESHLFKWPEGDPTHGPRNIWNPMQPVCSGCGQSIHALLNAPVSENAPASGLTAAERKALRQAAGDSLAGMFQGDIAALERAMGKL